jgi:hypothetical protein
VRRGTLRGQRLAGPQGGEVDRGAELAHRQRSTYWCGSNHETTLTFAADVTPPDDWDCTTCGLPAAAERGTAPATAPPFPTYRTPYEYLLMRRTPEEGVLLLEEALDRLRAANS